MWEWQAYHVCYFTPCTIISPCSLPVTAYSLQFSATSTTIKILPHGARWDKQTKKSYQLGLLWANGPINANPFSEVYAWWLSLQFVDCTEIQGEWPPVRRTAFVSTLRKCFAASHYLPPRHAVAFIPLDMSTNNLGITIVQRPGDCSKCTFTAISLP